MAEFRHGIKADVVSLSLPDLPKPIRTLKSVVKPMFCKHVLRSNFYGRGVNSSEIGRFLGHNSEPVRS